MKIMSLSPLITVYKQIKSHPSHLPLVEYPLPAANRPAGAWFPNPGGGNPQSRCPFEGGDTLLGSLVVC